MTVVLSMESASESATLLTVPNEILVNIFKLAENDKNLSLTCWRFYEIICEERSKNFSLHVDCRFMINVDFDLDSFLERSNEVKLSIQSDIVSIPNDQKKPGFFVEKYGPKISKVNLHGHWTDEVNDFLNQLPNLKEVYNAHIQVGLFKVQRLMHLVNTEVTKDYLISLFLYFSENEESGHVDFFTFREVIKQLILRGSDMQTDFVKVCRNLNLERLELTSCRGIEPKTIGNVLRRQRDLKELTLDRVTRQVWTIMCNHLKKLEKLSVQFSETLQPEYFKRIENFKQLRELDLNGASPQDFWDLLSIIQLPTLTSLGLEVCSSRLSINATAIAKNFEKLRHLRLIFTHKTVLEIVTEVLDTFTQLESLEMIFRSREPIPKKNFYSTRHFNENLKSLQFQASQFSLKRLISKFVRDFPDLEHIGFDKDKPLKLAHFQLLINGFKQLRKIEHLWVTEELKEIFFEYGRRIKEFYIDISLVKHPNKVLKDCSLTFDVNNCGDLRKVKVTREEERSFLQVSFDMYTHWKTFHTTVQSARDLKTLDISYFHCLNEIAFESMTRHLAVFGETVITLVLDSERTTWSRFKKLVEMFPNCETLELNCEENCGEIVCFKNEKLQSVFLSFHMCNESVRNCFSFREGILKELKLYISTEWSISEVEINELVESIIENQVQLRRKNVNRDYDSHEFTFEYSTE